MTRRAGRSRELQQRADAAVNGLDRVLNLWSEDRQQLVENATVNVVCAAEDRDRVQAWVDGMNPDWPVPVRVRTSCFLRPGKALYWQPDGVHAPSTPRTLAVRLPGS
jgi:hypothetical protein